MNMKMRGKACDGGKGAEGLRNRKRKDFGVEEEYTLGDNQVKYISAPPPQKKKIKQINQNKQTCQHVFHCIKKVPNEKINID